MAPIGHSPGGCQERHSGLPFSDQSPRVGMVTRSQVLSLGSGPSPGSPGRSLRNKGQSQASLLCGPEPGPSSLCVGRSVPRLESVGQHLSLPSSQSSDEGSGQTPVLQGQGSPGCPSLAEEQLVPPPDGAGPSLDSPSCPGVVPDGPNKDCVSFILANERIGFMDFLTFAAKRRFNIDSPNVLFTEADKGPSTLRQYNSTFRRFASFIRDRKPSHMSLNLAITYFRTLFESGLAPNTITSAKSGLHKIFYYGFDINLNDPMFSSISRACSKQRQAPRSTMLSWSLNKVLRLASDTDCASCEYSKLLRKTLFLLALASGARMSEIAALSRDPGFVKFLPSGEALLSPHLKFLAKNEDPQDRWGPWKIVPLPQDPSLCPVSALQTYLSRTSQWSSGRLFLRKDGGTLTLDGVRQQILYFITSANPGSIPKGHETRRVATSVNYWQHMDFASLQQYTGWKSRSVFMKCYFKNLDALKFHAVAAGKVVNPLSSDSE